MVGYTVISFNLSSNYYIIGLQVAQLRLIFASSSSMVSQKQFQGISSSDPTQTALAYVEWFSKPGRNTHGAMDMYAVHRLRNKDGSPKGSVIRLDSIVQPCYLSPRFPTQSRDLGVEMHGEGVVIDGDNCLDMVDKFWVNSFQDQATYQSVF